MSKDITININEKLCKQCGICSALCPKQVLEQSGSPGCLHRLQTVRPALP